MEVATFHTPFNNGTMDATMDMDMDIDIDIGLPEVDEYDKELHQLQAPTTSSTPNVPAGPSSDNHLQPEKVNISGVDDMTTADIKAFAQEHFPTETPSRIEWIDDSSANIPYSSPEAAFEALKSFVSSIESIANTPQPLSLAAKPSSSHPSVELRVRLAVQSDRKKPRAYEASRFYMMHPEHDPRERVRREFGQRRHSRRGGDNEDYRRRRFDDREHRRRREEGGDSFDATMYDDTTDTRNTSRSSDRRDSRHPRRGSGDLFSTSNDKPIQGRLRNRSASPARNRVGDEDVDFSDDRRRFRNRTPPPDYNVRDPHPFPRENQKKELFPTKELFPHTLSQSAPKTPVADPPVKELFPQRLSPKPKKELFPNKTPLSNHRRSDAFDAADETADLFASRMSIPFLDGSRESLRNSLSRNGLNIRGAAADQGMSIRGSGGLSIKGTAASKELFPNKVSNAGKELFEGNFHGRGLRRRRAEDMFD